MKINKILAAGVAATLAVTSLSAVASAETKSYTWKMDYTYSNISFNNERIQWLGDNDYIKSSNGSGTLAVTNAIANATAQQAVKDAIVTAYAAKQAWEDVNDALITAGLCDDTATGAALVTLSAAAAVNVPPALATANTAVKNAAVAYNAALNAAKTALNTTQDVDKQAVDHIGALKSASGALAKLKATLADLLTVAKGLDTASTTYTWAAGDLTKIQTAITNLNTNIDAAITNVDKYATQAEYDYYGDPLLADDEIGGIWIGTQFVDYNGAVAINNLANGAKMLKVTGAKLKIKGTKRGSTASESGEYSFVDCFKAYTNHQGNSGANEGLYLAFAPRYVNRPGYINLNVFGAITDVELQLSYDVYVKTGVDANGNVTGEKVAYFTQAEYDLDANKKITANALKKATDIRYFDVPAVGGIDAFDLKSPSAENRWVWDENYATLPVSTTALYKMYRALYNSVTPETFTENSDSKKTLQPFLKMTTATEGATIYRDNVNVLSYTDAYRSKTLESKNDFNQTYDDAGMGTAPKWFAGLASQTADFYNKQNNGQMIFKFKDPANADKWVSYGVPSTEVGLRTLQGTAMALFFNYTTSTGSIQSIGVVDKDAWTITFDIANVLDDFGGLTKATLEDIYYGLNTGMQYGDPYNGKGYVVESVTLQYDDSPAAVDASTDDDAAVVVADDDDDVVADDDDDDDVFADDDVVADDDDDDDDDAGIIEDDDDDDTDVNNDVDYVDGADDDANPGTGVGLAVIPAIVAAAAAVVSKKRK